jgi:hypothetical protein
MTQLRRLISIATVLLFGLAGGGAARGQISLERFERQLEQIRRDTRLRADQNIPADQRLFLDYGAYLNASYLSLDDPQLHNRALRQYDFTAYAHLNLDGAHDFFVRGRGFYRDFNDGDSFDDSVNGWDGRLERAYYEFDLARYLASTRGQQTDGDLSIKVGRDLAYWANGLTLSQELDGAVINLQYGQAGVQILAGITPTDTVDIDPSRRNFDGNTNRGFYGAMASVNVGTHRPFVYVLVQRDYNDDDTSTDEIGGATVTTRFDYNSNYFGIGSTGALSDRIAYGIEAVYESGDTLSNSFSVINGAVTPTPQQRDDISAWALDAQIQYLAPDIRHTRFSGEVILASGDSDRRSASSTIGGNKAGTGDQAFNGFGLLNTGLAFAPVPSNLLVLRGGASTFPFPGVKSLRRMQVGTDLFLLSKLQENAPIDEPTTDDRILGYEPDFYMNWEITSDVTLALRYGAFIPGEAIAADGKIRQFFYAGVTFAF